MTPLVVPELRTARLLLRGWDLERDLDGIAAINADPESMHFISGGRTSTRDESAERMKVWVARWEEHGFGLWAAELLRDGRFAGFVGLNVPRDFPAVLPAVEVGWRIDRSLWGRGLATEGGRASVEYAFGELGLDRLISLIHADNVASVRVAEKLGMTPCGTTESEEAGVVRVFELLNPEPHH